MSKLQSTLAIAAICCLGQLAPASVVTIDMTIDGGTGPVAIAPGELARIDLYVQRQLFFGVSDN